jgi:Ni,Fe-hydrogenase III large subunit
VVVAELERLHSHILWAGVAAHVMGFQTLFMTCFALRERIMDVLEAISGNRVNYAMNCIGGVNRDIPDPDRVLAAVREIEQETKRTLIPIFTGDPTLRARCAGAGVLSREQALAWGAVGPTARASGLSQDIRRAAPYAMYERLDFQVPVETSGDVLARIVVRALEILESCHIIEQALESMPPGPIRGPAFVEVPPGEAVVRIEAPRGEVFYYVASDGSDIPVRVKVRTPSFANMPAVRLMLQGASLADVPLIQASIDPCYSCTDR